MKEEQIILKGLQQGSEQAYKDLFTAYFSDLVLYANHFIITNLLYLLEMIFATCIVKNKISSSSNSY